MRVRRRAEGHPVDPRATLVGDVAVDCAPVQVGEVHGNRRVRVVEHPEVDARPGERRVIACEAECPHDEVHTRRRRQRVVAGVVGLLVRHLVSVLERLHRCAEQVGRIIARDMALHDDEP